MPGPYGSKRSANVYYQYGGTPMHYAYNWRGLPASAAMRSAEQADLADYEVDTGMADYETVAVQGDDYIDVVAQAQFHKTLGDDQGDVDAPEMIREYRAADAGRYPTWPVSMSIETGQRSVRHSGPEQTQLDDGLPSLGFFGAMSDNEKRLVMVLGVAAAGYLLWKNRAKLSRRRNSFWYRRKGRR